MQRHSTVIGIDQVLRDRRTHIRCSLIVYPGFISYVLRLDMLIVLGSLRWFYILGARGASAYVSVVIPIVLSIRIPNTTYLS